VVKKIRIIRNSTYSKPSSKMIKIRGLIASAGVLEYFVYAAYSIIKRFSCPFYSRKKRYAVRYDERSNFKQTDGMAQ
jgi:hypothetical protein